LRVTRRAATQIEKAIDYIETDSPQGATHVRERIQSLFRRSTLTPGKRPTFRACGASLSALIPI
jgi:plasmid stabilization system protein ParE